MYFQSIGKRQYSRQLVVYTLVLPNYLHKAVSHFSFSTIEVDGVRMGFTCFFDWPRFQNPWKFILKLYCNKKNSDIECANKWSLCILNIIISFVIQCKWIFCRKRTSRVDIEWSEVENGGALLKWTFGLFRIGPKSSWDWKDGAEKEQRKKNFPNIKKSLLVSVLLQVIWLWLIALHME